MASYQLDSRELATVLAALRYWQSDYPYCPDDEDGKLWDVVTNGGACNPLDDAEIDALCERINCSAGASP